MKRDTLFNVKYDDPNWMGRDKPMKEKLLNTTRVEFVRKYHDDLLVLTPEKEFIYENIGVHMLTTNANNLMENPEYLHLLFDERVSFKNLINLIELGVLPTSEDIDKIYEIYNKFEGTNESERTHMFRLIVSFCKGDTPLRYFHKATSIGAYKFITDNLAHMFWPQYEEAMELLYNKIIEESGDKSIVEAPESFLNPTIAGNLENIKRYISKGFNSRQIDELLRYDVHNEFIEAYYEKRVDSKESIGYIIWDLHELVPSNKDNNPYYKIEQLTDVKKGDGNIVKKYLSILIGREIEVCLGRARIFLTLGLTADELMIPENADFIVEALRFKKVPDSLLKLCNNGDGTRSFYYSVDELKCGIKAKKQGNLKIFRNLVTLIDIFNRIEDWDWSAFNGEENIYVYFHDALYPEFRDQIEAKKVSRMIHVLSSYNLI